MRTEHWTRASRVRDLNCIRKCPRRNLNPKKALLTFCAHRWPQNAHQSMHIDHVPSKSLSQQPLPPCTPMLAGVSHYNFGSTRNDSAGCLAARHVRGQCQGQLLCFGLGALDFGKGKNSMHPTVLLRMDIVSQSHQLTRLIKNGLQNEVQQWCVSQAGRPYNWGGLVDKRNQKHGGKGRRWAACEISEEQKAANAMYDARRADEGQLRRSQYPHLQEGCRALRVLC